MLHLLSFPLPGSDSALAAAYAHWSLQHGRPGSALDSQVLSQRLERFRQNAEMVAAHNADPSKTYTMHLGRWVGQGRGGREGWRGHEEDGKGKV